MAKRKYVGPKVRHIRASGRYDRSIELLKAETRAHIENRKTNLIDGSEASAEKREKALRQVAREKDWGLVTGDRSYRDDSYIMWSMAKWNCLAKGTQPIRTGKIWTGKGSRMPNNVIAYVVLEWRATGHRLVWTAGHPPSGVERGGRIQRTLRGMAWRIEVLEQKLVTNKLARKWKADGVGESNDWNADGKKASNRREIKAIMPRWRFSIQEPLPAKGTHGNRWIDFIMFRRAMRLIKSKIMKKGAGSDHRPVRTVLQFTKRPKNRRK